MKLHVLQIAPCFVDLDHETGGVSNIVRQISLYLASHGCSVTVVCGNRELGKTKARPGVIEVNSNLVEHVIEQRFHPLLGPRLEVAKYLAGHKGTTVAHIHTCFSLFTESAMLECIKYKVPFVFTPHGKLSPLMFLRHQGIKTWYLNHKVRSLVNQSAEVILSGNSEAALFGRLGFRRACKAIPNGFDESACAAVHSQTPLIQGPYVLFLGYLEARKQPGFLIEVFANSILRSTHKLIIAGPDSYRHENHLKKLAQSFGVDREVIFFGPAYKEDKWNLIKHADCFCLPSKAEGQPVVLSEAVGAEVPVLYSTGCNFPELAQNGCGIELDVFEIPVWKTALERICLDQEANRQMRDCAARIKKRYAWSTVCREWEQTYHKIGAQP